MEKQDLEEIIISLKKLRNDFIDEIPKEEIHGEMKYKCQNNWFQGVNFGVSLLIFNKYIKDSKLVDHYESFERYLKETNIHERYKNKEDIRRGNELLDKIILYLENIKS
jgi:hypothetical protein